MMKDERLFGRFLEAVPDAMIVVGRRGQIVMANGQVSRLFGYRREELRGQPMEILVPERYRAKHTMHRHGYFGAPGLRPMGVGLELFGLRKDGTEVPVEISLSPLTVDSETLAIAAIRDITERKKAEEVRTSLIREHAARVEAEAGSQMKDAFLAMLGHELRNPLGAILTAVRLLDEIGSVDEKAVRARGVIARQSQHLGRMVEDLLDVASVMNGKIRLDRRAIDLADAVRRCVSTFDLEGKGKRHAIMVDAESVWVDADGVRLEEILVNLIGNAWKYTPAGGSIGITVKRENGDGVFQVRDDGDGITADFLPRVFDLFVQGERGLDRGPGGLGIGLALVRQLVELHGGTVQASSDGPGRGSTFTVRLPTVPLPETAPHDGDGHT
jgi:PAS domain S-box-containing protein